MNEKLLELLKENPELIVGIVEDIIEKFKPTVYKLAQDLVNIYRDYSNNTDYPAIYAKVKKNTYDALINAGFTDDQALALMINDNIRLMNNIKSTQARSLKDVKDVK